MKLFNSDVPDEFVTIDIGMAIPVTGKHEFVYGLPMRRGFNLARDEINSVEGNPVKINFIVEDDMSTLDGAIAAFERLVDFGCACHSWNACLRLCAAHLPNCAGE